MEHRTNDRKESDLLARVYRGGIFVGLFRVKDIGSGGLCVIDIEGQLALYDFVRITLEAEVNSRHRSPPLYALIVQNTFQSAGAMWAVGQIDVPHIMKCLEHIAA
jgi:hypothetical protein